MRELLGKVSSFSCIDWMSPPGTLAPCVPMWSVQWDAEQQVLRKAAKYYTTSDASEPIIMYNIAISEYKCGCDGATHSLAGTTPHMLVCPCFHSFFAFQTYGFEGGM